MQAKPPFQMNLPDATRGTETHLTHFLQASAYYLGLPARTIVDRCRAAQAVARRQDCRPANMALGARCIPVVGLAGAALEHAAG
jgi:hypothetical protein